MELFSEITVCKGNDWVKLNHSGRISSMLKFFNTATCDEIPIEILKGTYLNLCSDNNEMENFRPYKKLLDALTHLANKNRPEISYAVSYLDRQMTYPTTLPRILLNES